MPAVLPVRRYFEATDFFIIGGGPSLRGFDWERLRGFHTIGCNHAFRLGPEICNVCFFSDENFFDRTERDLAQYSKAGGEVYTHCAKLHARHCIYLKMLRRAQRGLHTDALGFGANSGCGAVNLALIFGATRVFLLGFDCQPPQQPDETHWHDWRFFKPKKEAYKTFMEGWGSLAVDQHKFPHAQIINLGPNSAIPYFPFANIDDVLPWQ